MILGGASGRQETKHGEDMSGPNEPRHKRTRKGKLAKPKAQAAPPANMDVLPAAAAPDEEDVDMHDNPVEEADEAWDEEPAT